MKDAHLPKGKVKSRLKRRNNLSSQRYVRKKETN